MLGEGINSRSKCKVLSAKLWNRLRRCGFILDSRSGSGITGGAWIDDFLFSIHSAPLRTGFILKMMVSVGR